MTFRKFIKHISFVLLTFLFGAQTSYAKTELSLPQNKIYFSIEQNQSFQRLEKEVQPNIGFLQEKFRFVMSEGVSAQNNCNFSECFVGYLANGVDDLFSSFTHLKNLPTDTKTFLSAKNWDNALLTKLDGDLATTAFKNAIDVNPQLIDAWEIAIPHSGLRTNVTALNKIDNILSSGRVTQSKLKNAINGSLGDVLNVADNTNLGKILDRLNLSHVNDAHFDKIIQRLDDYPNLKQDLLNHSDWFETFDDILDNPGKYWEIVRGAEIPNNAALNHWAQGFEDVAAYNKFKSIHNLTDNQIVKQVTLLIDGTKIRIDYLGFKNGKYYLGEAKFTTKNKNWATDWISASTDNQKIVFPKLENGNVNSIAIKATDPDKLGELKDLFNINSSSPITAADLPAIPYNSNLKMNILGSGSNDLTIEGISNITLK